MSATEASRKAERVRMHAKGSELKRQQMDKQLCNRVHKVAMRMGDGTVSGCGDEARHTSKETLGQSGWWSGRAVGSGRQVVWVFPLQLPPLQNCIDLMQWSVVGWGGRE